MITVIDLFNLGMMRNYSDIIADKESGLILNLGPGNKVIDGTIPLEYPDWNAETDVIPYPDNSIEQIHAYHFLEHIQNVVGVISECQRVLVQGGHINIVVPYYNSQMAVQDLDHKHSFCERTWSHLFRNDYYQKDKLKGMKIHLNLIMGDSERTLALITQLVKI